MADGLYYNGYYSALYQGNINLIGGNVYLALLTSSYVPDLTNHTDWSQALNYEVAGTGYTAGGQVLTSPVLTIDAVNKRMQFKASNVVWASSAITARYGIVYLKTGSPSTSPLIKLLDFGSNQTSGGSGGNFNVDWDATGVLYGS